MVVTSTRDLSFHWADYVVFGSVLVISAGIGVFAAIKHRRATAEQLLTGNRKLPLVPVTLSLTASFMSAIFILGIPAEAYINSTEYWLIGLGYIPAQLITCFLIMPVFYKLRLTSAYQYLEMRFSRTVRIMGSLTFTLEMLLYMAVVMYAPALALSQVTGLSMEVSILATGLVCTFYTALGGIKAVVWTDAFQVLVIFTGFLALMIKGADDAGGWGVVFHRAREGARFTWDLDLDPDPFVRHTFWTLVVGGTFTSLTVYASNQAMLQRYLSVRNINIARTTILLHLPISEVFLVIAMLSGLVMYASYYNCDPLKLGVVSKADQLMPLFVMETLGEYPGLPGLFVACVYSAALSTVSSGVNSLAAVTLEDFLRPWMDKLTEGRFSARLHTIMTITSGIARMRTLLDTPGEVEDVSACFFSYGVLVFRSTALFYGLVTIGLAYLAGLMGSTVLQISLSIFGMVGGPLLGLLVVGIFLPCVNSWGAGIGLVCSLCVSLWVGVGAILYPAPRSTQLPPLNTEGCNVTGDVITNSTLTYTFLDSTVTESSLNWNYTTTNATTRWTTGIVCRINITPLSPSSSLLSSASACQPLQTYANGLQDGLSSDGSEQDVLTTRL
ncbi:hypothetical protein BaRGS_00010612 [Batillaria attramentaria]|uniref:Sodium-dependent multivitamin transporter n=1 Tax=Batillaria attramentaria TaxID=370345 RepID=A0ABD0LGC9_9CAEN